MNAYQFSVYQFSVCPFVMRLIPHPLAAGWFIDQYQIGRRLMLHQAYIDGFKTLNGSLPDRA